MVSWVFPRLHQMIACASEKDFIGIWSWNRCSKQWWRNSIDDCCQIREFADCGGVLWNPTSDSIQLVFCQQCVTLTWYNIRKFSVHVSFLFRKVLLPFSAKFQATNYDGWTVFIRAAWYGYTKTPWYMKSWYWCEETSFGKNNLHHSWHFTDIGRGTPCGFGKRYYWKQVQMWRL